MDEDYLRRRYPLPMAIRIALWISREMLNASVQSIASVYASAMV